MLPMLFSSVFLLLVSGTQASTVLHSDGDFFDSDSPETVVTHYPHHKKRRRSLRRVISAAADTPPPSLQQRTAPAALPQHMVGTVACPVWSNSFFYAGDEHQLDVVELTAGEGFHECSNACSRIAGCRSFLLQQASVREDGCVGLRCEKCLLRNIAHSNQDALPLQAVGYFYGERCDVNREEGHLGGTGGSSNAKEGKDTKSSSSESDKKFQGARMILSLIFAISNVAALVCFSSKNCQG